MIRCRTILHLAVLSTALLVAGCAASGSAAQSRAARTPEEKARLEQLDRMAAEDGRQASSQPSRDRRAPQDRDRLRGQRVVDQPVR